jgi:hypothetical protein
LSKVLHFFERRAQTFLSPSHFFVHANKQSEIPYLS